MVIIIIIDNVNDRKRELIGQALKLKENSDTGELLTYTHDLGSENFMSTTHPHGQLHPICNAGARELKALLRNPTVRPL